MPKTVIAIGFYRKKNVQSISVRTRVIPSVIITRTGFKNAEALGSSLLVIIFNYKKCMFAVYHEITYTTNIPFFISFNILIRMNLIK